MALKVNRQVCIVNGMSTPATKPQGTARERLLAAANELFYAEGVHTVGIDRVIEKAGVAKASLYASFDSKEDLIVAYLEGRAERRHARLNDRVAKYDKPREQILAIFDLLGEVAAENNYRGCAFVNASAEGDPNGPVRDVCVRSRTWVRALFVRLAKDFGAADPEKLGQRLNQLYDGAVITASMDRDLSAAKEARAMAELLLDTPARKKGSR